MRPNIRGSAALAFMGMALQLDEALRLNAEARIRALKIGFLCLSGLALLALFPCRWLPDYSPGSSEVTLYDSDPNHLWNRLHQALHVRLTDMGNPYKEQALFPGDQSHHALELDAFLWPSRSTYLRFGEPHKTALAVLDEFLAKDGEKLVREPVKREIGRAHV